MADTQNRSDMPTRTGPVSEADLAARIDVFFAQDFEAQAARLNDRILRVEAYLSRLNSKSEVSVSSSEGHTLTFARHNGQWGLYWSEFSGWAEFAVVTAALWQAYQQSKQPQAKLLTPPPEKQPPQPPAAPKKMLLLRDASIEAKSRATELLIPLIEKLNASAKMRHDAIVSAQSNLDAVERLLMNAAVKEGK